MMQFAPNTAASLIQQYPQGTHIMAHPFSSPFVTQLSHSLPYHPFVFSSPNVQLNPSLAQPMASLGAASVPGQLRPGGALVAQPVTQAGVGIQAQVDAAGVLPTSALPGSGATFVGGPPAVVSPNSPHGISAAAAAAGMATMLGGAAAGPITWTMQGVGTEPAALPPHPQQ